MSPHSDESALASPATVGNDPGAMKTVYQAILGRPTGLLLALACATIVLYGMRYARSILTLSCSPCSSSWASARCCTG